jgi:hypothetical protein
MFAWSQTLIDPVREFGFAGAVIRAFRLSRTLCSMTKFQRLVMKILVLPSAIRNRGRTGRMLLSEGSSSVENLHHTGHFTWSCGFPRYRSSDSQQGMEGIRICTASGSSLEHRGLVEDARQYTAR